MTGLINSNWLEGPSFLKAETENVLPPDTTPLPALDEITIDEDDPEVKVNAYSTNTARETTLKVKRFERYSDWIVLQRAIAYLIAQIRKQKAIRDVHGLEQNRQVKNESQHPTVKECSEAAKITIIKAVQNDVFTDEIEALKRRDNKEVESRNHLKERRKLLRSSNIVKLDPFLDQDGILRVGGRLNRSSLTFEEKHPILLPKKQIHNSTHNSSLPSKGCPPPRSSDYTWGGSTSWVLGSQWSRGNVKNNQCMRYMQKAQGTNINAAHGRPIS